MMSEELYGVVFVAEDGGDTHLVAVFDVMSVAEALQLALEEDRYVREVEGGETAQSDYEPIYEVVEIARAELDDSVFDRLERGLTARIS
jgi:hypothetical protein